MSSDIFRKNGGSLSHGEITIIGLGWCPVAWPNSWQERVHEVIRRRCSIVEKSIITYNTQHHNNIFFSLAHHTSSQYSTFIQTSQPEISTKPPRWPPQASQLSSSSEPRVALESNSPATSTRQARRSSRQVVVSSVSLLSNLISRALKPSRSMLRTSAPLTPSSPSYSRPTQILMPFSSSLARWRRQTSPTPPP